MNEKEHKASVEAYWSRQTCGSGVATSKKFSRQYFEEIEEHRFRIEPEVFSLAQFTRFRGQKVLEVGVGAGTDFIQWVRAGAKAYGVDLTEEAVEHVNKRLEVYGLSAEEVRVADADKLPYPNNTFDLVFSWGVIQYVPDTFKALAEIIRVTRPGGRIKIMIYNRRSLWAFYKYLRFGLLQGKPFRSISSIVYQHCAGGGAKAFTDREVRRNLLQHPVSIKNIRARATKYDLLLHVSSSRLLRLLAYVLACLLGFDRIGWFMTIELEKVA